jgi:hypothetical protein
VPNTETYQNGGVFAMATRRLTWAITYNSGMLAGKLSLRNMGGYANAQNLLLIRQLRAYLLKLQQKTIDMRRWSCSPQLEWIGLKLQQDL